MVRATSTRVRICLAKNSKISLPQSPRLEFVNNNLEELKDLWENLAPVNRVEFAGVYGNIVDLMYASINTQALQALVHFWDPTLKYFAFNMFDLTPTIEEYRALINISPCTESKVYVHDRKLTLQRSLSKFLCDIHASDIKMQMKTKGGRSCIPFDYLISFTCAFLPGKNGLSLLALFIYDTIMFPRIRGCVEEEVVKVFVGIKRRVNPVIPIMAETFRSLSHCRVQGKGKFFRCAPMLFIWISSHLKYPGKFGYPQIKFSNP